MASGYPMGSPHERNHQWMEPKPKTIPAGTQQLINGYQLAAERSVDPFKLLHNMLDPWTFGFERHLEFMQNLEDVRIKTNYPPYNIKTLKDDKAEIELAIAGFKKADVSITYKENIITVEGNRGEDDSDYSYKGIAARNFVQKFAVADDVIVTGAGMEDGFLTIKLERILPEAKKEKTIPIK
jgi:molecular chaperone IbpA